MNHKMPKIQKSPILRVASIAAFVWLLLYADNVRTRISAKHAGTSVSTEDGGLYVAEYYWHYYHAYGLVKVYRASDGALVAEREFAFAEAIQMLWEKDQLMYANNDKSIFHDGILNLPPTPMDRLFALIP